MDPGSLLSLLEATQSAVESSDLALRAAEEALTAARAANTQAKAALKAVKEFSAGGGGEIQMEGKRNKCETCRKKNCLHGELLQESLCKDPSGFILRAIGESWTAKYLGKIGRVISCNQTKKQKFLNVQWENSSKTENFTFSSKAGPKFVIECKLKPEFPELQIKEKNTNDRTSPLAVDCPSCRFNPCKRGKFLTEALPNPSGLKVRSVGKSFPERYRDALGTVIIKQGGNITLRWDNTGEIRENTINSKSGPRFLIECDRVSSTELSPSPANKNISVEDISSVDNGDETEDFIMLSSNKNPVVDVDEEDESKKTEECLARSFAAWSSLSTLYNNPSSDGSDGKANETDCQLARITQNVVHVEEWVKKSFLLDLLEARAGDHWTIIIAAFINVSSLSQLCNSNGFPSLYMLEEKRKDMADILKEFKSGRFRVLLMTHLDAFSMSEIYVSCQHVITYDFPSDGISWYDKMIRITGRNGNVGLATTFFNDRDSDCSLQLFNYLKMCNQKTPSWLMNIVMDHQGLKISADTLRTFQS